jgi:uncharacterized protein YggU (UPF0235/DUF167 family)
MKISAIVHPNSKKPRIEKDLLGAIHIYVSEPPLEGKANKAVINVLAKHFSKPKSCIQLTTGKKSKIKIFEILED